MMGRREVDLPHWEERDRLLEFRELLCHGKQVRYLRQTIGSARSHSEKRRFDFLQMFSNVSYCPMVLQEERPLIEKEEKVALCRYKSRNP
jgi:hypothetical protein